MTAKMQVAVSSIYYRELQWRVLAVASIFYDLRSENRTGQEKGIKEKNNSGAW